jgi:hypothetical protein
MGKALFAALCLFLTLACSKKPEAGKDATYFRLEENSPEYHSLVTAHMKEYCRQAAGVDSIRIEGNKLFIIFKGADRSFDYSQFARNAGVEFNQFKKKKLSYRGVTVYCINDSGTVAHAIVQ